jgi:hypothetical protein
MVRNRMRTGFSRMRTLFPVNAVALSATCILMASCIPLIGSDREARGGGSDTETLTASITTLDGKPAARTLVKLIPADYDPSHPDTTLIRRAYTDSDGVIRFDSLSAKARYNLIAGKAEEKAWAFAGNLKAGAGSEPLPLALAKVFLFTMHSEDYNVRDSGIAYFPGTDILTHCNGLTESVVDSVPMGALRFVVESRAGWKHDTTLTSVEDTADVVASRSGMRLSP